MVASPLTYLCKLPFDLGGPCITSDALAIGQHTLSLCNARSVLYASGRVRPALLAPQPSTLAFNIQSPVLDPNTTRVQSLHKLSLAVKTIAH